MFTRCPDCQTTFRVSAEVLQQAGGRVRCGGCGKAFDALAHLPQDEAKQAAEDGKASKESTSDQNKQLLETLDKLAGPEVELEDTGVEWRVLEKSGKQEIDSDETGSMKFVVEDDEIVSDAPAVRGRQGDLPQTAPDTQESLGLPETEPSKAKPSARRYDDDTVLPDDFEDEDDLDELPFLEAETPKRQAGNREAMQDAAEFDDARVDLSLGEPEEWVDLLDEVNEEAGAEVAADAPVEEEAKPGKEAETEAVDEKVADDEPPGEDMPSDIDTQFFLQAEEMGLDTGNHPITKIEGDEVDDGSEAVMPDETDIEALSADEDDQQQSLEEDEDEDEDEVNDRAKLESTDKIEEQIEVAEKAPAGEAEDQSDISHEEIEELANLDIEEELTASDDKAAGNAEESEDTSATIIGGRDVSELFKEDSPMVETIIMEGDLIGDSVSQQNLKAPEDAATFENPGPLEDTYSLSRGRSRGGRRASDLAGSAILACVVVLSLLLIGQITHQSRKTLATYGAFNQTIGSIYRVLGKPVTPEWDIRGWRFEATNGNVDEEDDLLTIYSRIANKSSQALPYPLVHISLTDRWEDSIGSRVLEPNEYLAGDLDPRKPVPTGENFTAVITIESPPVDATGFRLTACYRISPGRVRCADEHFKD